MQPARSQVRSQQAAASRPSDWRRAGTAPTACSAHWTHEAPASVDESPDGVVGVPAGGDRRARAARPSVWRRRWPRPGTRSSCSAVAPRHRPEHASVDRRDRRGCTGGGRRRRIRTSSTSASDMMAWTLAMGHSMIRAGLALRTPAGDASRGARTSCTHTTGWSPIRPSRLAEYFDVPLVSTIHATEAGRHSGWVSGPISRQVHAVESWLVRESDSLITCSASMSRRDHRIVRAGPRRDTGDPQRHRRRAVAVRKTAATARVLRSLLYLGRLEYEKGIHDAIAALPRIRRTSSRHDADDRRRWHPV